MKTKSNLCWVTAVALLLMMTTEESLASDGPCMVWSNYYNTYLIGACAERRDGPFPAANILAFAYATTRQQCEALNTTQSRSCQNQSNWCSGRSGRCYDFFWLTEPRGNGVCNHSQESGLTHRKIAAISTPHAV